MASFRIPFRLLFLILCIKILISFSSSLPVHKLAKQDNGIGFKAPLIHWSSPESPFYDPKLSPGELVQASVHSSRARADSIRNLMMSSNSKYSLESPISRVGYADKAYVMKFSVGTPAVYTYAIPDTGSSLSWLQCGTPYCINCYKQRIPLFNPTKSSTYVRKVCNNPECKIALDDDDYRKCNRPYQTCKYHLSYLDGSYSEGDVATDIFTFPQDFSGFGNYTLKTIFGCGNNNSDPEKSYTPGIVGLVNQKGSLIGQMNFGQFSYCVSVDTRGGSMEFRFGSAASISGFTTQLARNRHGLYIFKSVDGIYVNEFKVEGYPSWVFQYVEGGRGGLLIDTGSSYTELYYLVLNALVKLLKEHIQITPDEDLSVSGFPLCYYSDDFLGASIPDIEFRFSDNNNTYLPFYTRNTWVPNGRSQMCLSIFSTNSISILGIEQQRDIKFGFDLTNSFVSFTETYGCKI